MNVRVTRPAEALLEIERQITDDIKIGTDGNIDVRPLHLDDNLLAIGQSRPVHLGGRGGGQRLLVECGV